MIECQGNTSNPTHTNKSHKTCTVIKRKQHSLWGQGEENANKNKLLDTENMPDEWGVWTVGEKGEEIKK